MAEEPHLDQGPILITVEYEIDPARAAEFEQAMCDLRLERLRDGAIRWELFRDLAEPRRYQESFVSASWAEHLRQHERVTAADQAIQERVRAFHVGEGPPQVAHLVSAPPASRGRRVAG